MCEKNTGQPEDQKDTGIDVTVEKFTKLLEEYSGCIGDKVPGPQIESFIGCKIINAEPMDRVDFQKGKGETCDVENAPGYKVYYPDGYTSWSPKNVFEEAYRLISQEEKRMIIT